MAKSPPVLAREPIGSDYPNEAAFRRHIRYRAKALGWRLYEVPDSRFAHAAGFPDLVLVRGMMLAFVECKTDIGRYTPEQSDWLGSLLAAGARVFLWRPRAADEINEFLEGRGEHWAR